MMLRSPPGLTLFLLLTLAVSLCESRLGGVCAPSSGATFTLTTQSDMDLFKAGCTTITGNVAIICNDTIGSNAIRDLQLFQILEEITGYLRIEGCGNLTSLSGLSYLKRIKGNNLYTTQLGESGYAVYIRSNPLLTSLSGLENLTFVGGSGVAGAGRVFIKDNANLCYTDHVNQERLIGSSNFARVVDIANGASSCAAKSCSASCSCGYCLGPGTSSCQGYCSSEDHTARNIILIVIFSVLGGLLLLFFLWMCLTNRCGCRMRCCRRVMQVGAMPQKKNSFNWPLTSDTDDGVKETDPFAGQQIQQQGQPRQANTLPPVQPRPSRIPAELPPLQRGQRLSWVET